MRRHEEVTYLDPGERFNDPDEVLLQQVVVQLGQVSADDGVVLQFRLILHQCLQHSVNMSLKPQVKQ